MPVFPKRPAAPAAVPTLATASLAHAGREPLGEVLLRMGALDRAALDAALERQRVDGRTLGEMLVAEGLVTRDQLGWAMASRIGVEYLDLADGVDPVVAALLDPRSARRYNAVPVRRDPDGRIVVAMADPANVFAVDDLRILTGAEIRAALAHPDAISAALASGARADAALADLVSEDRSAEVDDPAAATEVIETDSSAPVVRLVNTLVARAIEERASDIHLEPQQGEMTVRFRVDGVMRTVTAVPLRLAAGVASRVKIMADLDIAERRAPQDGRVGIEVEGRRFDLRVATLPTVHGEKVVIRVLDGSNVLMRLADLGFAPDVLTRFEACYRRPHGAVLVTGPTGSGKSTTLYGALNQLNSVERNIITVEDPVEYRLPGVNQVQVNPKAGLSFAAGLRAILRCDPDVVMIGEVRDRETAGIAVESALTGHLVLATIHTNDSAGALTRLTEMGVEPFLSASAITGILAQRLARRLCAHCRRQDVLPHAALRELADTAALPPGVPDPAPVWHAVGCGRCSGTGYRGRVGVYEMLVMSEALQRLAVAGAPAEEIARQARREGMRTLREDGLLKVLGGHTTVEELARAVG